MYTKDPIYGNHIGIVINNNDPEFRNRVQVFVPHLSMTLYSGWNSAMKDIALGPGWLDNLDISLQNRLMRSLPWAEAARPIFGGNGSLSNNPETNKSQIIRQQGGTSNTHLDGNANPVVKGATSSTITGGSKITSSTITGGSGGSITATNYGFYDGKEGTLDESTLDTYSAGLLGSGVWLDDDSVAVSPSLKAKILAAYPELGGNVIGARITFPNGKTVTIADTTDPKRPDVGDRIDFWHPPVPGKSQPVNFEKNFSLSDLTITKGSIENRVNDNDVFSKAGYKDTNEVTARAQWWRDVVQDLKGKGVTISGSNLNLTGYSFNGAKMTTADLAKLLQKSPVYQKVAQQNPSYKQQIAGGDPETIAEDKKNGTFTPADGNAPIVALDPTVRQASGSYGNVTNPGGMGSKPKRGTMVWVFFLGGDVMKPVYFAGVTEPNSESRTGGGGAPVQLTGEPSTSRNTNTSSLPSNNNNDSSEDNLNAAAKYNDQLEYFINNEFPPGITNTEAAAQYMLQQAGLIDKGKGLEDGLKNSRQAEFLDGSDPNVEVKLKPGDLVSDGKVWGIVGLSPDSERRSQGYLAVFSWQNGKLREDAALGKKTDFTKAYRLYSG
jgi:hypothetical protein